MLNSAVFYEAIKMYIILSDFVQYETKEQLFEHISECDVIIYDITQNAQQIDEAVWAVSGKIETEFNYSYSYSVNYSFTTIASIDLYYSTLDQIFVVSFANRDGS